MELFNPELIGFITGRLEMDMVALREKLALTTTQLQDSLSRAREEQDAKSKLDVELDIARQRMATLEQELSTTRDDYR